MEDIEIERYYGVIVSVGGIDIKALSLPDWDVFYVEYPSGQMKEYRDVLTKAHIKIFKVTDKRIYFEE